MKLRDYDVYGHEEVSMHLSELSSRYPMLQINTIGQSVLGRTINSLKIGSGDRKLQCNASFHANEWITTSLLMKFTDEIIAAYQESRSLYGYDVQSLLSRTSLWLVPMVNPDGVELVLRGRDSISDELLRNAVYQWNDYSDDFQDWKANIRGVDLNDQFPAFWEAERERRTVNVPASRDYGGEAPLTEPEACAIAAFTLEQDFDVVVALHTQGEEIYWNYRDMEPSHAEAMANRLADVSEYAAIKLTDSDAGFKDWFIQETSRPGFTIELGSGVNPLPISDFDSIYPKFARLLLEALKL